MSSSTPHHIAIIQYLLDEAIEEGNWDRVRQLSDLKKESVDRELSVRRQHADCVPFKDSVELVDTFFTA